MDPRASVLIYRFQQLDLIQGRLCVVFRALHHLHRHEALPPEKHRHTHHENMTTTRTALDLYDLLWVNSLDIPGQPHRGEVSPAQLTDHMVSAVKQIADLYVMIPA